MMNDFPLPNLSDESAECSAQAALYALGALSQTEARAVAAALPRTPGLAAEVAAFEQVVALLGLSAPEAQPAPALRRQSLDRIAATPLAEINQPPVASASPATAQTEQLVMRRASDTGWRACLPGVFIKTLSLDRARGTMTALVRLAPGACLPPHRHSEVEESFILSGNCRINGETLGVGDYRRAPRGTADGETTTEQGVVFLLISSMQIDVID